jgi:superfamily II DNA or RNA helicase
VAEAAEASWPEGVLFWPPRQIQYQTEYIARMYLMRQAMLAADLGTGKTVMSLGTSGLATERGDTDLILVVCEHNKLGEWLDDFGVFTRIGAAVYHGPRRRKMLDAPLPPAVITTYETLRQDIAVFPPKGSRSRTLEAGPLMGAIEGRKVIVIYDEITKLGHRSSKLYKSHYWMLARLRKADPGLRVLGLSATPMETDYDNIFSEMRLIAPHAMPTVKEYEDRVVASRDPWGRPKYKPEGAAWFRSLVDPWILRKRKSDADVREFFPPLTEKFTRLEMKADQLAAYQALEDLAWDKDRNFREVPGLDTLLRQVAGDPWAVAEGARTGNSDLTKMVADVMREELERCSSAKAEELAELCDLVMSSGGKLLVFTFYGHSVLPALKRRLGDRPVWTYHGGMTPRQQDESKMTFRRHEGGAILLASDAAARGINLPEISYVVNYDVPRTHSLGQQRAGRGHRLGKEDPLTVITLVLNRTAESRRSVPSLLRRNREQDYILGDEGAEGHVSAADRALDFAMSRPRKALA